MKAAQWPEQKLAEALARGYFRTVDLFSGCGGMTLGFHASNFVCVSAVESNATARESHRVNFEPRAPSGLYFGYSDITQLEPSDMVEHLCTNGTAPTDVVDVIVGGPPCQAFSRLGRAALWKLAESEHAHVSDPRATMYEYFLRAVEELRPIAFVLENVPEIGRFGGTNVAEEISEFAEALGYVVRYTLLNAVWYGVPQYRDRMIMIGVRHELDVEPAFPKRTHFGPIPPGYATSRAGGGTNLGRQYVLEPHPHFVDHADNAKRRRSAVTVREAFQDLPQVVRHLKAKPVREDLAARLAYTMRPARYTRLVRRWEGFETNGACDGHTIRLTPRDYQIFRRMKPGHRYPDALAIANTIFQARIKRLRKLGHGVNPRTKEWKAIKAAIVPPYSSKKFPDKYRKLDENQPSRTVPAHLGKDCYSHIHPDRHQARTISLREAARLQSFPDGFRFHGTLGERFTQIGNAVPPLLARAIAQNLRAQLLDAARRAAPARRKWTRHGQG